MEDKEGLKTLLETTSHTLYEKFGHPKLILSITGGALNFPLVEEIKNAFKLGILKAARTTSNLWIITGGMDVGIMQLVGESVANEGLTVIGIPSYKRIQKILKLDDQLQVHYRL
jgi:hypothetical protein